MPALSVRRMDDDRYIGTGLRESALDAFCRRPEPLV
jgi:hypothetical protein